MTTRAEHEELRSSVQRFIAAKAPMTRVRELMETDAGVDAEFWAQAGSQLGLQALTIPEEYGGAGFSFVEQAIVLEELGAALHGDPYLASAVIAAQAILSSGDEAACRDLLPGIASGESVATLAFAEDAGSWDPETTYLSAVEQDGTWRLDGHKNYVLSGHTADLVLTLARVNGTLALFASEGTADGLLREVHPTLDQTRKLARIDYTSVQAQLIGAVGDGARIMDRTLDVAAVALAAEQLGGAQRALDTAVEYTKVRYQFGRPIGANQALKHRCADMLMELESLRSAVSYAATAVANDSDEVPVLAALLKAYASEVYFQLAGENIQLHGGIGFTWEHDAHLYFKRAKSSELFLGDGNFHRERLAERIGL